MFTLQLQEFPIDKVRSVFESLGIRNFTKLDNGNVEIKLVEDANTDKVIQNLIDCVVEAYVNTVEVDGS